MYPAGTAAGSRNALMQLRCAATSTRRKPSSIGYSAVTYGQRITKSVEREEDDPTQAPRMRDMEAIDSEPLPAVACGTRVEAPTIASKMDHSGIQCRRACLKKSGLRRRRRGEIRISDRSVVKSL
jgi:hypothetical protein